MPLMDTLSDPFNGEVLGAGVVMVLFKPGSDGVEKGAKAAEVVVFSLFLFVIVAQPPARIHPTTITRAHSSIRFIGVLLKDVCFLLSNSMLHGIESLHPWSGPLE
jgi:hypothetical protein